MVDANASKNNCEKQTRSWNNGFKTVRIHEDHDSRGLIIQEQLAPRGAPHVLAQHDEQEEKLRHFDNVYFTKPRY